MVPFPFQPVANRKQSKFRPDPSVPPSLRAENGDFWTSGWSRGHMAPAGNNKHCQDAMDDTFLLSNIVPQVGKLCNVVQRGAKNISSIP